MRTTFSIDEDGFLGFEPLPHRGEVASNALIDELREQDDE